MTIDTLAYTKAPEAAGVERDSALAKHVLPQLVTKSDLEIVIERLEHRLMLRLIAIIGAFDAALFALPRFVH